MDLLKKHWEKIILGFVLLGLVAGAGFLLILVGKERQELEDYKNRIISQHVEALPALDLTPVDALVKRAASPTVIDFAAPNKVVGPMTWQKMPGDGRLVKVEIGQEVLRLKIIKIAPLFLIVSFENIFPSESGVSYVVGVTQEAASSPAKRTKKSSSGRVNEKKDVFTIRGVEGPADNPTALNVELNDSGERVVITKEKPFRRVEGYMADLFYEPEKRNLPPGRRVGDMINVAGEAYKIVAINEDEVVLSAQSNQKKFTIKFNPASASP